MGDDFSCLFSACLFSGGYMSWPNLVPEGGILQDMLWYVLVCSVISNYVRACMLSSSVPMTFLLTYKTPYI